VLTASVLTFATWLILGAVTFALGAGITAARRARRHTRVVWWAAARSMRIAAPVAGAAAIGIAAAAPSSATVWPAPVGFLVSGALPTAGAWVLLASGRLEAAGRLSRSRRLARFGGLAMCAGGLLQLAFLVLTMEPRAGAFSPVIGASFLALAGSGCVALLTGLSGKPRPSGWFAVALYVGGILGAIHGALGS
jgi:hypothetical protein